jgi:hypothetical protein
MRDSFGRKKVCHLISVNISDQIVKRGAGIQL